MTDEIKEIDILAMAGEMPYRTMHYEKYMSADQLCHFERILLAWLNKVREDSSDAPSHLEGDIKKMLQKILDIDYGLCDSCGIEIGLRRLENNPIETICIDCQTYTEMYNRQSEG